MPQPVTIPAWWRACFSTQRCLHAVNPPRQLHPASSERPRGLGAGACVRPLRRRAGSRLSTPPPKGHQMSQVNINRVVITGNLTADPELRTLPSGTSVCKLRLACNTRRKDSASGEWVDKPNYLDVTVWGGLGETVAKHTAKGRGVAIDGRLEWRA